MWVSQFLSNRVSDIVTNGAFFRLSLNSLNMQENSFQKNLPNSSLYRNLKHPLLQEEEDILEIKIEAALLQPGSGLERMLKRCSCRNSIIQNSERVINTSENTFNMTHQRGGKRILAASHIRRHSLVNLEAKELFWIWVIFFDICATVPGFKAGINVCLILSKSQGNLNHQHSAESLVSGFAGTWKYVPDRGPTPKTGKFLLLIQAKILCFVWKIVST